MIEEIPVSNLKRFEGSMGPNLRYTFLGLSVLFAVAHLVSFFVLTEFFEDPLRYMGLPLILWFTIPLLVIASALFYNGNRYPTIWTGDAGLFVSFNFRRVFIPWNDVIGIKEKRFFFEDTRIYARKITWFHYIYGSNYHDWTPAIFIDPMMNRDTYDELLDEIEKYVLDPYL
jgi:ABC-type transport system involved in multi-copper enzyme maturation permease subunit